MKNVIFLDLDGVIFDSYDLWDMAVAKFLNLAGISYTSEIKAELWQLNMPEAEHYLEQLFLVKNISYRPEVLQTALVLLYEKVPLMTDAKAVLTDLAQQGYQLYAVTSNHYHLAEIGLKSRQLFPYFTAIYSCLAMGYDGKEEAFLQTILTKERLKAKQVIFVEDSISNLKMAKNLGISGIYLENQDNPQNEENRNITTIRSLKELSNLVKEIK